MLISSSNSNNDQISLTEGADIQNRVILSGSFNPLHAGHRQLLDSAFAKAGPDAYSNGKCFELALKNADKGALQADDPQLLARIGQFAGIGQ